jgi:glycosyltransferase involved in cell wall biosynthesis/SAM-dependent methyltransferase
MDVQVDRHTVGTRPATAPDVAPAAADALDVLFVLNSLALGGSERKIVRVANQLRARGVKAGIASLNEPHTLARYLDNTVPWWRLGRRGKLSIAALRRLLDIANRRRPRTLVAVNLYPALYVLAAAALARSPRPRTVCLLNTSVMRARSIPWRAWLYRRLLPFFDRTVHGCDAQRVQWVRPGSRAWQRSAVIYNGVDVSEFRREVLPVPLAELRAQLGIPESRFLFGSVGRLVPEKNHAVLVTALARLRAAGVPAHLVVAGEGPQRRALEEQATRLGVRGHLSLPGALPDVRPVLASLDVFVLPSTAVESFSNAALEAMAMSKPVILSAIGGAAEMVHTGIEGFVVPLAELDARLAPLLAALCADSPQRTRLGLAARACVESRFSLAAMVDRYEELSAQEADMQAVYGLKLRQYFPAMIEERLFPRKSNLIYYQRWLFDGVDFRGKRVLDIGAGSGLNGFYAACNGAREVLCIDPEADGSTAGGAERFTRLRRRLGLDNIRMQPAFFQSFDAGGAKFDVILLHNSINHLDETACINLLSDPAARQSYRLVFEKLAALAQPGAQLILCDCTRYNFFASVGLRSPISPTIEWDKHQAPEVWAELLAEAGFASPRIRWSSFNLLGAPGRWLLGNRFAAYFLKSHFCLSVEKQRR